MTTRPNNRHAVFTACVDIIAVVLFVAIGRRNHDEGTAIDGIAIVAAPFLIALVGAWLSSRAWRTPGSMRTSVIVWLVTVFGGLELRYFVFDRGTARPFVIVATLVLGTFIVGGRFVLNLRLKR
ncbi:MAG: hypothetical protein ABR76_07125 [Acidimicrobiia bacterium BACL6 MAG-121220-bin61]|nr:MAG: hypothetical protein ABR76_07125 [Acidimicrobiia bacterium BACL6 MAG-121220-bin61]